LTTMIKNQPKRNDTNAFAWPNTSLANSLKKAPNIINARIKIAEVKKTG